MGAGLIAHLNSYKSDVHAVCGTSSQLCLFCRCVDLYVQLLRALIHGTVYFPLSKRVSLCPVESRLLTNRK